MSSKNGILNQSVGESHEELMQRAARALADCSWWLDETPEDARIRLEALRAESAANVAAYYERQERRARQRSV